MAVLGASPGRVLAQIEVPFERPRNRARLFASPAFHALREDIAERLDADVLSGLAAA